LPNSPKSFRRQQQFNSETLRDRAEISQIECNDRVGVSVDRRFENQFITWVTQLRPPYEVRLDGVGHRDNGIDENSDLIEIESRCKPMLGEAARCLVF